MALSSALVLIALWAFDLSGTTTFANAQAAKSLQVVMVPQGVVNGCCSQAFYNATSQELFKFVNATTALSLQLLGLSMNDVVIKNFSLINTNQCVHRERFLLRGGDSTRDDPLEIGLQREASTTSTCSACTKPSCSSYCSGCYLCSSSRRHLERDLQIRRLGVPISVLNAAVAAISADIVAYFAAWLTNGTGAILANGCMGTPSRLQINVTLA